MVDVTCRFTDDFKKFSHKTEAISSCIEQSSYIDGCLNLTSG